MVNAQKTASGALPANFFTISAAFEFLWNGSELL